MNCKSCKTELRPNERQCPNCGRTASPGSSQGGADPTTPPPLAPLADLSSPDLAVDVASDAGDGSPIPDPDDSGVGELPESADLDADGPDPVAGESAEAEGAAEELELSEPAPPEPVIDPDDDTQTQDRAERPKPRTGAKAKSKGKVAPEGKTGGAETMAKKTESIASPTPFRLEPEELRARLAQTPDLVEPGLQVYAQGGKAVGVGFETEVGDIDLLAIDEAGALVLVLVMGPDVGDPVAPVLERLGWVGKHVAKPDQTVRAVVLLQPPAPDLGYTAKAVADSVSFKTWRVTVALDDIEP